MELAKGAPPAADAPIYVPVTHKTRESVSIIDVINAGDSNNIITNTDPYAGRIQATMSLDAGGGNDLVYALGGSDLLGGHFLYGGAGDDRIFGGWSADTIVGGEGNDYLAGDMGHDTYYVLAQHDGIDVVDEVSPYYDGLPGWAGDEANNDRGTDTVEFGPGVTLDDLTLSKGQYTGLDWDRNPAAYDTLDLAWGEGKGVRVVLPDMSYPEIAQAVDNFTDDRGSWGVEYFKFADGTRIKMKDMLARMSGAEPSDGIIRGGVGDDVLTGTAGNDVLQGNGGNDLLNGGAGDDTYVSGIGDGVDTLTDSGGTDTLQFGAGITPDMLSLGVGSLLVRVANGDAIHIEGFDPNDVFGSAVIEKFRFADGMELSYEQVLARGFDISGTGTISGTSVNDRMVGSDGDDAMTSGGGNDVLSGGLGSDLLDGGAGTDAMAGGAGDDTYLVDNAGDTVTEYALEGTDTAFAGIDYVLPAHVENLVLTGSADLSGAGNEHDNRIDGNAGANLLDGAAGNDGLEGGSGDDTFAYKLGDGLDHISDVEGAADLVAFGPGLSLDNVALRVTREDDGYTARLRVLDAHGCEQPDQGLDFEVTLDRDGRYISAIEGFRFADGAVESLDQLLIKTQETWVEPSESSIVTGRNDDIIHAGPGREVIRSGTGNDIIYAGPGGDTAYGEGGADYLAGSTGKDVLDGGWGADVVEGSLGNDVLRDPGGNNALLGGMGADDIAGGEGSDFIAGGWHDDTISTGAGANLVAFNHMDGRDTILPSAGAANTLSLGGGIDYDDLAFRRNGNDLVLETGSNDSITFKDWYLDAVNRNFVTLQTVEEGRYANDALPDGKVQAFDFQVLVERFDLARASNPSLNRWSLMDGLLEAHLGSSDTAALGGDLAYWYGTDGALSGMGLSAAQEVLNDPQFGVGLQMVHQWSQLDVGAVRLG